MTEKWTSDLITFLNDSSSLKYCPKCGYGAEKIRGYHLTIGNKCERCDWSGKFSDLLNYEQMINKTRSEKLKEILL
jgi:anaerobic ribonucleoside-triphosphate reductase